MRMKLVKRYWCDFCNKGMLVHKAMENHEKRCTMNPSRQCRVCTLWLEGSDDEKHTVAELMAILPTPVKPNWRVAKDTEFSDFLDAIKAAEPAFRRAARNCPACMMAALRQKGIEVGLMDGFDFTNEMKNVFNEVNELREQDRYY